MLHLLYIQSHNSLSIQQVRSDLDEGELLQIRSLVVVSSSFYHNKIHYKHGLTVDHNSINPKDQHLQLKITISWELKWDVSSRWLENHIGKMHPTLLLVIATLNYYYCWFISFQYFITSCPSSGPCV